MAKVTDLDALLPDDLEFKRGDTVYTVPGDLPIETVLQLFKLWAEINQQTVEQQQRIELEAAAQVAAALDQVANANGNHAARARKLREILNDVVSERVAAVTANSDGDQDARMMSEKVGETLLAVLRIRQPDLTEVPFGAAGRRIVMQRILVNLGVIADPDAPTVTDGEEGEQAPPSRRRARSPRSS